MADDVLTTDAQAALGTSELGPQGPTPKPGQAVPPTDVSGEMGRAREAATHLGAEFTGVADVRRALSGETPWAEAIGGAALAVVPGGAEARIARKAAGEAGSAMSRIA